MDDKQRSRVTSSRRSANATISYRLSLSELWKPLQPAARAPCFVVVALILATRNTKTFDAGEGNVAVHGLALRSRSQRIERWGGRRSKRINELV